MEDLHLGHGRRVEHRIRFSAEFSVSRHDTSAPVEHQVGAVQLASSARVAGRFFDDIYQHVNPIPSRIKRNFRENLQGRF